MLLFFIQVCCLLVIQHATIYSVCFFNHIGTFMCCWLHEGSPDVCLMVSKMTVDVTVRMETAMVLNALNVNFRQSVIDMSDLHFFFHSGRHAWFGGFDGDS